MKTYKVRN